MSNYLDSNTLKSRIYNKNNNTNSNTNNTNTLKVANVSNVKKGFSSLPASAVKKLNNIDNTKENYINNSSNIQKVSTSNSLSSPNNNKLSNNNKDEMSPEDYQSYILSPFSFIDKVIANPFTDEFVYLTAAGPYDLEIITHNKMNPNDYYTMSRAGVTHFYYGETDFTLLDQWEREYFLYTKMMEVSFFKKFQVWKAYVNYFL